jgi:hypothetical protein
MHRNFSHGSQKGKAVKANALSDPLVWADRTSCGLFELSSLELARAASERGHRCECADLAHCAQPQTRSVATLFSAHSSTTRCGHLQLPDAQAPRHGDLETHAHEQRRQRSSRAAAGALVARTCSS